MLNVFINGIKIILWGGLKLFFEMAKSDFCKKKLYVEKSF